MNGATPLERRYRRLLGWYPAAHRAAYGEEMIGASQAALYLPPTTLAGLAVIAARRLKNRGAGLAAGAA